MSVYLFWLLLFSGGGLLFACIAASKPPKFRPDQKVWVLDDADVQELQSMRSILHENDDPKVAKDCLLNLLNLLLKCS